MTTRPFRSEPRSTHFRLYRRGERVLATAWNELVDALNRHTDAVPGHDPGRGLALRLAYTKARAIAVYRSDGTLPATDQRHANVGEVLARWNIPTRGPDVPLDSADFGLSGAGTDPIEERVRSPFAVYPDPPEEPGGWLTPIYEDDP